MPETGDCKTYPRIRLGMKRTSWGEQHERNPTEYLNGHKRNDRHVDVSDGHGLGHHGLHIVRTGVCS